MGLRILQPLKPSEPAFLEQVRALEPGAFAVAAYGCLLPDRLLALAPKGAWNVHPSLLPRWRGPAPIHRALMEGDAVTGVSIMRLTSRMDAGPIARKEPTGIGPRETRGDLERRLAELGANLLAEILAALDRNPVVLDEQDEAGATYAAQITSGEGELKWVATAEALDRRIRALLPAPGAFFVHGAARVKVLDAAPEPGSGELAPGTLIGRDGRGGWLVACGGGSLRIAQVQPEGKKPMTMDAFVIGRRQEKGSVLG
jgi:methionyl-tRNA formyltransferase